MNPARHPQRQAGQHRPQFRQPPPIAARRCHCPPPGPVGFVGAAAFTSTSTASRIAGGRDTGQAASQAIAMSSSDPPAAQTPGSSGTVLAQSVADPSVFPLFSSVSDESPLGSSPSRGVTDALAETRGRFGLRVGPVWATGPRWRNVPLWSRVRRFPARPAALSVLKSKFGIRPQPPRLPPLRVGRQPSRTFALRG